MAQAEVFKCTDKFGKPNYQSKPCQDSLKEQQLPIKADPLIESQGKDKRQARESEYDTLKAGRDNAENRANRNELERAEPQIQ